MARGTPQQDQQECVGEDGRQWYAKCGDFESVMFVESTPQSELKKRIEIVVKKLKLKIKVVEQHNE